ncbi:MAG: hypothetical protein JWM10_2705 [Myxococcaceae bacterium]|nr:hypothetical protein [Myxococcaceae bacterium]
MPKSNNAASASTTPRTSTPRSHAAPEAPPLPEVVGNFDAFTHHRTAAGLIPLSQALRCHADLRLAYFNAMAGRSALVAARAELAATGFRLDASRLDDLESLLQAVIFAAGRVEANPSESHEVISLLREGRPLRQLLMSNARAQSLVGRCSAAEVARIAKGRGAVDTAQDLVDLAVLHATPALVVAGGVVADDDVRRAKAIGTALLVKIRPSGTVRGHRRTAAQLDAVSLRDRLWTLLVQWYEHLERAAGAVWGRRFTDHVPALQARHVPRTRDKAVAPVAPTG